MASIITWFEIPAVDFDRAINFYSKVFGFKIELTEFNGVPQGIINMGKEGISGTIIKSTASAVQNPGPVLYFKVLDMTSTLQKIKVLGGSVVKEKAIIRDQTSDGKSIIRKTLIDNEVGYYALFKDSEGHTMGLYSNS